MKNPDDLKILSISNILNRSWPGLIGLCFFIVITASIQKQFELDDSSGAVLSYLIITFGLAFSWSIVSLLLSYYRYVRHLKTSKVYKLLMPCFDFSSDVQINKNGSFISNKHLSFFFILGRPYFTFSAIFILLLYLMVLPKSTGFLSVLVISLVLLGGLF